MSTLAAALGVAASLFLPLPRPAVAQQTPSAPHLAVTLERDGVLTHDMVRGEIWIENGSAQALDSLRLHLSAPGFVHLGIPVAERCETSKEPLPLPAVPPREILHLPLCVVTAGEIVEGDYSVVFSLVYRTRSDDDAMARTGYVQASRVLRVGVFGHETVAGVSLRLAAFLIPGLLFFILLRWLRADPKELLKGPEVITASVIVSILLIAVAGRIAPTAHVGGMSIERFGALCLGAALLAAAVSALAAGVRWYRKRHLIWATDSDIMKFCRLLRALSPRAVALRRLLGAPGTVIGSPVTVTQKDGTTLYGTVAKEHPRGQVRLLGWLRVNVPPEQQRLEARLKRLVERRKWADLARVVQRNHLDTRTQSGVHRLQPTGIASDIGSALEVIVADAMSVRPGIHGGQLRDNIAQQPVITIAWKEHAPAPSRDAGAEFQPHHG